MIYRSIALAMLRGINWECAALRMLSRRRELIDTVTVRSRCGCKFVAPKDGKGYDAPNMGSGSQIQIQEVTLQYTQKKIAKMRPFTSMLLLLLAAAPLWAKPKVEVRVKVNDGFGKNQPQDSLSRTGSSYDGALQGGTDYFLNVTVLSDNAEAVANNNGHWCIKGDTLLGSFEYCGMLDGKNLEIDIPQKDGKIKKKSFVIFDHKWRKESDI